MTPQLPAWKTECCNQAGIAGILSGIVVFIQGYEAVAIRSPRLVDVAKVRKLFVAKSIDIIDVPVDV
jgi:hypothetical protein